MPICAFQKRHHLRNFCCLKIFKQQKDIVFARPILSSKINQKAFSWLDSFEFKSRNLKNKKTQKFFCLKTSEKKQDYFF